GTIDQRHGVAVWRGEDHDRCLVDPVGLPATVDDHPESRHVAGERCREVVCCPSVDASKPTTNRHGIPLRISWTDYRCDRPLIPALVPLQPKAVRTSWLTDS